VITAEFESRGVVFRVGTDNTLTVDAPSGQLSDTDWQRLATHKAEIIRDLRLVDLRREYAGVNDQVKRDGRFRVHDARLRVDGFAGCIQRSGRCPAADPVKCGKCDRGHTFVGLDDCRCGRHG
jgi:hypothetical protein